MNSTNGIYISSASSVAGELLNEFITKLSDDPVYNLSIKGKQATWTYDVDSDITYEARYYKLPFEENIRLIISEGRKVIDTMYFERLEVTSGSWWVKLTI